MNKLNLLAASAAFGLALSGCGGVQATSTNSAPDGTNQGVVTTAPAAQASPSPEPAGETGMLDDDAEAGASEAAEVDDGVASFGEAFTYDDGLSVTVGKPTTYQASVWAWASDRYLDFVAFEVFVVNKTGGVWDPGLFYVTVQSDNEEGDQVYDSEKLKSAPTTKLLNGREAKFTVAFGVANPKDLVMEVTPDFEHEAALFQR